MRNRKPLLRRLIDDHLVVGSAIVVTGIVLMYLSYTALNGFPWQSSYSITADVPDAAQLSKNADVRVGGARIGQVLKIEALPREGRQGPRARLHLKLDKKDTPLPVDTTAEVRIGSVLGSKYLSVVPGKSKRTIPEGGNLPLSHTSSTVGIDDAFQIFSPKSRKAIQSTVTAVADGLAGRGTAINTTVGNVHRFLPGLQRVLATFASSRTDLGGFVRGAHLITAAFAPVAGDLSLLLRNSAGTLGALDAAGDSLGEDIELFPPAATSARRALRTANPVLADVVQISRDLRPAADELPGAFRRFDPLLRTGAKVAPRLGSLGSPLSRTFVDLNTFTSNPATARTLRLLGDKDLATFGASAFVGLGAILATVYDAERNCGVASRWVKALRGISGEGDSSGNWLRMIPIVSVGQTLRSAKPSADLHANIYPNENAQECESGNEGYAGGQLIGNPPGLQGKR